SASPACRKGSGRNGAPIINCFPWGWTYSLSRATGCAGCRARLKRRPDMYVAVKGGERAILNSYRLVDMYRRRGTAVAELTRARIRELMPLAASRVMAEGALYDPELPALAIKQAAGDPIAAVFRLRAVRTTLPRFGATLPVDTARM